MASDLVKEACRAYGIPEQYVFASSETNGVATIVTNGGTKVRYQKDQVVKRLTPVQLGVAPKAKPAEEKKG